MQQHETERIQTILSRLEQQYGIALLYACESGSRAWGFASTDSDYDARFLYIRPANDYLSILEPRDVIEYPVDSVLDIGGWDLRKALRLLLRSNAPLIEWLQSPVVYRAQPGFAGELFSLAHVYFSPRAATHHYISMAANAYADLQGEQVRLKRYFYALRPLLAAMWVVQTGGIPPMEFHLLRQLVRGDEYNDRINELIEAKGNSTERDTVAAIPVLNKFIGAHIEVCNEAVRSIATYNADPEALNVFFRSWLSR